MLFEVMRSFSTSSIVSERMRRALFCDFLFVCFFSFFFFLFSFLLEANIFEQMAPCSGRSHG